MLSFLSHVRTRPTHSLLFALQLSSASDDPPAPESPSALSLSLLTFILFSLRPFSLLLSPVASCLNEMPFSQASRGSLVLLIIYRLRIRAFQSSSHVRGRFAATLCPHGFTVFIQPFATMCLQRSSSYLGSPFEFLLYANDILRRSVTGTFF